MPRRCARSRTRISVFSMAVGRSNSVGSSSIRPASILDRSRMSLMSDSRCRPDSRMSPRYSACLSLISPNIRSERTSEKPMIALSGVRSSCDMLARNSLLCRLAVSSCAALRLDLAEQPRVLDGQRRLRRRTSSAARSPAARIRPALFRLTTSPPSRWSSRSSGTASSDR